MVSELPKRISQLDNAEMKERILCVIKINYFCETNANSLNHESASLGYDVQLHEQTLTKHGIFYYNFC